MTDPSRAPGADSSVDLLRRARAGDSQAIDRLCQLHRPLLRRWAQGRLPQWARTAVDTDDLVQETLLHTIRRVDGFEPKHSGAFGAYLRTALRNRIQDEIRKVRRRPQEQELREDRLDPGASPLEAAVGRQTMRRYEDALDRLDDEDRALIVARIEMGLSFEEVARTTRRSTADAARMAVSRALVRLAREMDRG